MKSFRFNPSIPKFAIPQFRLVRLADLSGLGIFKSLRLCELPACLSSAAGRCEI